MNAEDSRVGKHKLVGKLEKRVMGVERKQKRGTDKPVLH